MDPERDGFYVELTFLKTLGRGRKNGGARANPGKIAWKKLTKKKHCVIPMKNKDNLCCARAVVTIKEFVDKGSPKRIINASRSTPN